MGNSAAGKRELSRLCRNNYVRPRKTCLLEWGTRYVNDFGLDNYISFLTGVQSAEDCMEPCRSVEGCVAWTFDQTEGACYFKTESMATR